MTCICENITFDTKITDTLCVCLCVCSPFFNMVHLEDAKTLVRLFFLNFSSAFNCIQPLTLISVEVAENDKYLGTMVDNKLNFESHVDAVSMKAHQHVHFYAIFMVLMLIFYGISYLSFCLLVSFVVHYKQKLICRELLKGVAKLSALVLMTFLTC